MICPKCGKYNPDVARFCSVCGRALSSETTGRPSFAAVAAIASKTGIKNKLWLIILIAVVVVVIILFASGVFSGLGAGSVGSQSASHTVSTFYDYDSEKTYLIVDGVMLDDSINGSASGIDSSANSEIRLLMTDENDLYLLSTKTKAVQKIANDIYVAQISQDGKQIAYINDDEVLYQYDVANAEKTKVANDVIQVELSPNGNTLLYSFYDYHDGISTLYAYKNGEKVKIGDDLIPLMVSDDGKDIYYYNNDRKAVYYTSYGADEKVKIQSGYMSGVPVSNSKKTQIIFTVSNDNGSDSSYYSEKGSESVKISGIKGYSLYRVSPMWENLPPNYPNDVLTDKYYRDSDGSVYYLGSKLETEKIASDVYYNYRMSDNNKTLVCIRNDNLYRYDLSKGGESEKIANDVVNFDVSRDGSQIYYINDEDELYLVKGNAEPVKIANDVDYISLSQDNIPFFITDISSKTDAGTLYIYTGKEKEKIANDALRLGTGSRMTYYCVYNDDDDYDLYVTRSGSKFELMKKGLDLYDY